MKTHYKVEHDGTGQYGIFTKTDIQVGHIGYSSKSAHYDRVEFEAYRVACSLAQRASMPTDLDTFKAALMTAIHYNVTIKRILPNVHKIAKAALNGYLVSSYLSSLGR